MRGADDLQRGRVCGGGRCERERYERIRVFDVCLGIYSAKVSAV